MPGPHRPGVSASGFTLACPPRMSASDEWLPHCCPWLPHTAHVRPGAGLIVSPARLPAGLAPARLLFRARFSDALPAGAEVHLFHAPTAAGTTSAAYLVLYLVDGGTFAPRDGALLDTVYSGACMGMLRLQRLVFTYGMHAFVLARTQPESPSFVRASSHAPLPRPPLFRLLRNLRRIPPLPGRQRGHHRVLQRRPCGDCSRLVRDPGLEAGQGLGLGDLVGEVSSTSEGRPHFHTFGQREAGRSP